MIISCNLMPLLQRLTAFAKSLVERLLVSSLPADRGGTHSLPVRSLTEFNFELWSMELNASLRKDGLLKALTTPMSTGVTNELAYIKLIGSVPDRLQSPVIGVRMWKRSFNKDNNRCH